VHPGGAPAQARGELQRREQQRHPATPLAWTHAQFIRLARDVEAGRVLEQPAIVAQRYTG
jgi:hypothetical protein